MKKAVVFTASICLGLVMLFGVGTDSSWTGEAASLQMDEWGNRFILYENQEGGLNLRRMSSGSHPVLQADNIVVQGRARNPLLKRDRNGQIWALWEDFSSGNSHISISRIEGNSLSTVQNLSRNFPGANLTPEFTLDLNGSPWIIWINRQRSFSQTVIHMVSGNRTWVMDSVPERNPYSPRIICDLQGTIWAFRISFERGMYQIFTNRWEGSQWTADLNVSPKTHFPILSLDAESNAQGAPWIVWSGYDGQDYELYSAMGTGTGGFELSQITQNKTADLNPTVAYSSTRTHQIIWSQQGPKNLICSAIWADGGWVGAGSTEPLGKGVHLTDALAANDEIFILYKTTGGFTPDIQYQDLKLLQAAERDRVPMKDRNATAEPLDINRRFKTIEQVPHRYTGFGDSITYGVESRRWFPDKGYVPRLELLINNTIPSAQVLNRGIPGEDTIGGLARLESVLTNDRSIIALIMEGTNDMTGGIPVDIGAFNLEEMVKICFKLGVYPIIATIIPRSDFLWDTEIRDLTIELNDLIRQLASKYSIPLVDMYEEFINHPEGHEALFGDGAHPNEAGYQLIAESWLTDIRKLPRAPVNMKVQRENNKILFYDEPLNVITWEKDPTFAAYNTGLNFLIFRRDTSQADETFVLVDTVSADAVEFLDRDIEQDKTYIYMIQGATGQGIRGPSSKAVWDK
ncbi:GDSL-type esterase/lipase family protein [Acidobacteriota bacterium]